MSIPHTHTHREREIYIFRFQHNCPTITIKAHSPRLLSNPTKVPAHPVSFLAITDGGDNFGGAHIKQPTCTEL